MDKFNKYLRSKTKEELKEELIELFSSFEIVRNYYDIKYKNGKLELKLIKKYQNEISLALDPTDDWQSWFDLNKVDQILVKFNSSSTVKYYFELGIYTVNECTELANAYGGDYGDEFYSFFIELYENIIGQVIREGMKSEYQEKLRKAMENSLVSFVS